jgi:hypothetical protein
MMKILFSVIALAVGFAAPASAKTQHHRPISASGNEVRGSHAFASAVRAPTVPEPIYMMIQTKSLIDN